ncbi:hypothetical protein HPB50_002352 [Hyalomma asiaticum]|uniref:Uncharacterized protein n=1 Tax=Hyalomma asiaticum TaxID=266040 RepID=A0ACB7T9R3_HYAAI|nr:hypothetical protein HPB50_002352 [Hyalomma asiaticum]
MSSGEATYIIVNNEVKQPERAELANTLFRATALLAGSPANSRESGKNRDALLPAKFRRWTASRVCYYYTVQPPGASGSAPGKLERTQEWRCHAALGREWYGRTAVLSGARNKDGATIMVVTITALQRGDYTTANPCPTTKLRQLLTWDLFPARLFRRVQIFTQPLNSKSSYILRQSVQAKL